MAQLVFGELSDQGAPGCATVRFVRETKKRPEVDKRHPDIQIVVFVDEGQVVWYVDTTGAPLFKRGWRQEAGEAPLRENLAAGILRLAGWTGEQVLLDPMCGAGTFLIEAAFMAQGIPPGERREFAFRHLQNFNQSAWDRIRHEIPKAWIFLAMITMHRCYPWPEVIFNTSG
jgi:putative N6-adenine-specific DNA methylase